MPTLKQVILPCMLVLALLTTAVAQVSSNASVQRSSLTITATAVGDRVRITAPSSVVQMHVEIYATGGQKLFDQEIRGGNVFDWHVQDGQAQRLAPGAYACVVTAKSVSGKLIQKIGRLTVGETSVGVQTADSPQLTVQQTQAIGPVEENSSWTIPGSEEPQTSTVIANDGKDGQMIRGRGALTFRIGNFFSGIDQEQMRLTEAGDLGIGTSEPRAKLEVAGAIRAERFLVVKPGQTSKASSDLAQTTDAPESVQPLVAGTGTQNQIAKWTDNAGTLGDSGITETGTGRVGVGIASPLSKFHVSSNFDALRLTSTNDTSPVWAQFNTSLGSGLGYFGVEGNTPGTFLAGTLPYATALSSGGSGTALQLGSAGSVKMTILSGGNVGIGITAPATRLHVNGGDILLNTALGNAIELGSPNSETGLSIIKTNIGRADLRFDGSTLKLVTGPANSGPPSGINGLVINSGGNVGIGVTDPFLAKLQVETSASTFDAILGKSNSGYGVHGESLEGAGLFGRSNAGIGVSGESNTLYGVYGVSTSGAGVVARSNTGNIVEGYRFSRVFHIDNVGTYVGGSDFAEALPVRGDRADYEPGDVLVVSTKAPGKVEKASRPYDQRVAGIYSTRPGMLGADKLGTSRVDADEVPVAIVGIVPTKVSTENGPILLGDLLTTSYTPGYAMKASPVRVGRVKVYRTGTILGKALEPLTEGRGVIRVLVSLR